MENQHQIETIVPSDFSVQIDRLNSEQKKSIIQKVIIPLMNIRRGKSDNLSSSEIHEKIYRPPSSEKPGESFELFHELIDRSILKASNTSSGINKEIASELADVTYYGLQPNAEGSDKFDNDSSIFVFNTLLGIPNDAMLAFCIIKYSTRLKYGDIPNYKEIENEALQKYLNLHPELTSLWNEPEVHVQEHKPGWIWYHVHGEEYPV